MGIHKSYILLLVMSLFLSTELQVSDALFDKFYVHIINGFNNATIGAHCRSKDDDLGNQFIPVGGEFHWNFKTNLFGTTLFYCHLWWIEGHITYLAYWHDDGFENDICRDGHCRWKAEAQGISSFNVRQDVYQLQYKWQHWRKSPTQLDIVTNIIVPEISL